MQAFSEKYEIIYPLLSDEGSKVIRSYGIFNTEVKPDSRSFGIPHPGIYIIDENLTVVEKYFEQSHRPRLTAKNVLVTLLDKKLESNVKTFETSYLTGRIGITDTIAYRAQLLTAVVDIKLKDGFHVYGKPIPRGYIPLEIKFETNPIFEVDPFQFPKTREFKIESLPETFNILPEEINLKTFLRITNRPEAGNYTIKATVSFQACDDEVCMIPEKLEFSFPLRIVNQRL